MQRVVGKDAFLEVVEDLLGFGALGILDLLAEFEGLGQFGFGLVDEVLDFWGEFVQAGGGEVGVVEGLGGAEQEGLGEGVSGVGLAPGVAAFGMGGGQ